MRQGRLAPAVAGRAVAVAGAAVAAAGEEAGRIAVAGVGILLRLRLHQSCRYIKVRLDDEQGTARL